MGSFIPTRTSIELSRRFGLVLAGGYGGSGWGEASNSTREALATISWRFRKCWSAFGGYRALNIDRGSSFNGVDLTMHGPLVGVTYRFGGAE